jgi:hypothetical protein
MLSIKWCSRGNVKQRSEVPAKPRYQFLIGAVPLCFSSVKLRALCG